jgi:outer membrane protein W
LWVVVAIFATAVALPAQAADHRNVIRFGLSWVSPTGDLTTDGFFVEPIDDATRLEFTGDLTVEPDAALGLHGSWEWRFSDRFGLELGLVGADHDVEGRLTGVARVIRNADNAILDEMMVDETEDIAEIQVTPWVFGALAHLTPEARVDVWIGIDLAYVMYDDLEIDGESVPMDDELTGGAVVGLDVPLGDGAWAVSGAIRYIATEAEPSDSGPDAEAVGVDPWIVQVGLAYRF